MLELRMWEGGRNGPGNGIARLMVCLRHPRSDGGGVVEEFLERYISFAWANINCDVDFKEALSPVSNMKGLTPCNMFC
ncbi:hypothetical protein CDAR_67211 [Caerostris darwini]|uniref:Uncharacterized protein n=1 Tax=Caerostris darwini TaxID=1538125 RepID=A0AAV4TYY6_9ARAC|nr:hypothetical protein CDAR_67211 [Caerostris darwini]